MSDLVPFVQSTELAVSDYARITRGGLVVADGASEDDLQRISDGMAGLISTSWFVIGDLGNYWKSMFPSTYRSWLSNFSELDSATILKFMGLCRRFPDQRFRARFVAPDPTSTEGRRSLTYGHFNAVRSLGDEQAAYWLERAAAEDLGVKALTSLIRGGDVETSPILAPPSAPDTQFGYIYDLGNGHRLLCGDTTVRDHLYALMSGEPARLVVTSPPYNQQLDSFKASGMQTENTGWVERMAGAYEDSRPEQEYQDEQVQVIDSMLDVTTSDASFFYNHKNRYRDKAVVSPLDWLRRTRWEVRQEIVWDRGGSITLNARMFMPSDERVYWLRKSDQFLFNDTSEIKSWSSVWKIAAKAEAGVSAPFPVELPTRAILACSDPGDVVLDPYGGSGTTLIAAERNGRRCFLVERNPAYCDVIRNRYRRFVEEHSLARIVDEHPIIEQEPATGNMPQE